MKGYAKIELVIKFESEDQYSAEDRIEEMYEHIKDAINKSHSAEVVETFMDTSSFEEGKEGKDMY